jgi:hypothetical protein
MIKKLGILAAFAMFPFAVSGNYAEVAQPRIISPTGQVDISGKDTLEFKWYYDTRSTQAQGGSYEIEIYKAGMMVQSNMVYEQKVAFGQDTLQVDSKLFQPGQGYSWQIRFIKYDLRKSDWVISSFKVSDGIK